MPDLKWPIAALEIRLQDSDPTIRAWAARWLRDYHGEAGATALKRFVDAKRAIETVAGAADLSRIAPAKAKPREVLIGQGASTQAAEPDLRAFLSQALADPNNALTPDFLAACPPVSLLPRVMESIRRGVQAEGDWEGLAEQVLLVTGAGMDHLRLAEVAVGRKPVDPYLADAEASLRSLLTTVLVDKKGSVEMLAASLGPIWPSGGTDEMPRPSAPAVMRLRGQLAWRIAASRALATDIAKWPFGPEAASSAQILLLSLATAALRTRGILDRVRDEATAEQALAAAEAPYAWLDDAVFAWTVDVWGASRRSELTSAVLGRIEATKDPIARSNLLRLFGEAKDAAALPRLIDLLARDGVDGVERGAFSALSPFGAQARAALKGRLEAVHPSLLLVAAQLVIDDPCEESEAFLLAEWDAFARKLPSIAPLCMAAELFASPKFLGKMLELWRPGEDRIEATIAFLAKWTPETAPPVRRIVELARAWATRDAERRKSKKDDVAGLQEMVHEFHRLPLVCAACGAVYKYEVGYCFLQPVKGAKPEDVRLEFRGFQRVVQCKRCLARDEYGVSEEGQYLLQCRQQLALSLLEAGKPKEEVFARSLCILDTPRTSDGQELGSTNAAIQRQLGRVHAHAGDADAWTRLGNLYHHGGLYAEARGAFETALSVEPKRADAMFGLAILDHEEMRLQKAAERFRAVVRLLVEGKVAPDPGYAYFDESVRRLLAMQASDDVPFKWELGGETGDLSSAAARQKLYFKLIGVEMPTAKRAEAPREAPKTVSGGQDAIGRNDPCPCGSGKKYKKCCLTE